MKKPEIIQIQTTVDRKELAEKLTNGLLEKKLCACVATFPAVTSKYWWKGSIETANESMLVITTLADKYNEVVGFISENHTYEVPEILAIIVAKASESYSDWVIKELG